MQYYFVILKYYLILSYYNHVDCGFILFNNTSCQLEINKVRENVTESLSLLQPQAE